MASKAIWSCSGSAIKQNLLKLPWSSVVHLLGSKYLKVTAFAMVLFVALWCVKAKQCPSKASESWHLQSTAQAQRCAELREELAARQWVLGKPTANSPRLGKYVTIVTSSWWYLVMWQSLSRLLEVRFWPGPLKDSKIVKSEHLAIRCCYILIYSLYWCAFLACSQSCSTACDAQRCPWEAGRARRAMELVKWNQETKLRNI